VKDSEKEPLIPSSPRTDRSASPEGRVEDLSSDVGAFQFAGYPVGLGTPQAGDFAPRQELSWEDSTQELPVHSFAVEGDTTVVAKSQQAPEGLLNVVGSAVGEALKQAVVQLRPQLPPAALFKPRRQIPGRSIPLKEAGPVPGGWEDTVIYHQKKPLERRHREMEQPSRHRQQPSESNIRRDPAPTGRTTAPTAAAAANVPAAAAATNVPPAAAATADAPLTMETTMEDDRDEFLAALCHRLTLTIEERLVPRILSLEEKVTARPREPEIRYGPERPHDPEPRYREFARDPELQYQQRARDPELQYQQRAPGPELQYQQRARDPELQYQERARDPEHQYRERVYRDFHNYDGYQRREWTGKPRFRPDSLPTIKYGDDVNLWVSEMDHAVIQHGEEIVCPEIFANCFTSGDAIKLWYMDMPSEFKLMITTKAGCWERFKSAMEKRFTVDIGMRQMTAEDRCRMPGESYADFGIQKVSLIRRAFAHLAPSAVIAMVHQEKKIPFQRRPA
jgi:hypothetical protein